MFPIEFLFFGLTLLAVAVFHRHSLPIAACGLATVMVYQWFFAQFPAGAGWAGLVTHASHEWVILTNLLLLLVGFALVSRHFEESGIPATLPRYLPDDWTGAFALLVIVFAMSAFLDNIAAIVAASNAGGSGSVIGDTTTTMMWISGVAPIEVAHAYVAAVAALFVFGVAAARRQQQFAPIIRDPESSVRVDWVRVMVVAWILACAVAVNVFVNLRLPELADQFPFIGATVAITLLMTIGIRQPDWRALPGAIKVALFLLCLVASASLMPVESLPAASWQTALALGFLSATFDNIPLTALALEQGWPLRALTTCPLTAPRTTAVRARITA